MEPVAVRGHDVVLAHGIDQEVYQGPLYRLPVESPVIAFKSAFVRSFHSAPPSGGRQDRLTPEYGQIISQTCRVRKVIIEIIEA
jgi:hypothetical protein